MKQEHIDLLKETLQQYGSDFCELSNSIPAIYGVPLAGIEIKNGRIYYINKTYKIALGSSPISKAGIEKFVESYWYWSKK